MKTRKGSSIVVIFACAVLLSAGTLYTGKAAGSTEYKSQGKIVFDNNTADTADDVVFDAGDFRLIHDMVTSGKNQIGEELNKYPSVNLDLSIIPDFNELAGAIDTLTDDATAEDKMILKEYTAYAGGDKITGSMENNADAVVDAASVVMDAGYTYFSIPVDGYYNVNSKIKALNSDFMEDVKQAEYDKGYQDGLKDNSNSNIAAVIDPNDIHVYDGNGNQNVTVSKKSAVYMSGYVSEWDNSNAGSDHYADINLKVNNAVVKSGHVQAYEGEHDLSGNYTTHGPSLSCRWNGIVNAGSNLVIETSKSGYYDESHKSHSSSQIIVVGLK